MKRRIRKVAILGSGIMGSRIACHFANIGVEVLLLDIAPKELTTEEIAKNLTLDSPLVMNKIVNESLKAAIISKPSPLYHKTFVSRIKTGNFTQNFDEIKDCDWIIEAVIENLEIKKSIFKKVDDIRLKGSLISSNTSGIPITLMTSGMSDDFKNHFCGTHFFNPPRYLQLFEVIPTQFTSGEVLDFLMDYGDKYLGKTTVLCKDTPAFIANRIGTFSIVEVFHAAVKFGLKVEDIDKLTGPVIGHAKSATFRTVDIVGLDTLIKVATGLYQGLPIDEKKARYVMPKFVSLMDEKKWYGDKTKQGFYKKVKDANGKTKILSLNLHSLEYEPQVKSKFATLESTILIDNLKQRLPILLKGKDVAGDFYRDIFFGLMSYSSHRIPEISDNLYSIDEAICNGFNWEIGPFETWDSLDVRKTAEIMKVSGYEIANWVNEMLAGGNETFYKSENGEMLFYDIASKKYQKISGRESVIILDNLRENKTVWSNAGSAIIDIGDGVLNFEFRSKMNSIGSDTIEGLNKAIELAEKDFNAIVIGNNGPNFSVGANLALLLMYAAEQEWDEIDLMVRNFQRTVMRLRQSAVPVVAAPHHLTFGGACEIVLHSDAVQMAAETYIGLVEFGVGLIPAGGGTKEMILRASDEYQQGDIELNTLGNYYMNIATGRVSTSAHEAREMKILRSSDSISINPNRLIADAKTKALQIANAGYTKSIERKDIKVQGKAGMALFFTGSASMVRGNYISEHDKKISEKLAFVMCGGDLSSPQLVSEQYLLDLEREAFLSLCGERKTLERIQYMLKTGKPLRN